MTNFVVGLFGDPESALAAAGSIQTADLGTPELMSPVPMEGVEEVLGEKKSVIKRFSLFGAIFGGVSGFLLAAITAVLYAHPTGGRPIITFPPYLIITYELTILFGIVFTVIGFFVSARLPNGLWTAWWKQDENRPYVPEAAVDKFAVSVSCASNENVQQAETILRTAGAEEVRDLTEEN
jgi:molybdopterin-containing oxidoreductase family membrane subunit